MSEAAHSARRPGRNVARAALVLVLASVLAWALGLGWFIRLVDAPVPPFPRAEGIVAFTGGAERVETALQLLAHGQAPRLLLSGIGGGAGLPELDDRAGVDAPSMAAQITLGRGAQSTRGNAIETAAWAQREDVHSLIVVTAAYHMPRALLELQRMLPEVTLYPVPVRPSGFSGWRRLELMAVEFTKYLSARTGLSAIVPDRHSGKAKRPPVADYRRTASDV